MNLRNIDGTEVKNLGIGSHKRVLFDCDICGKQTEQEYRNYLKQPNENKLCRVCRNTETANSQDVREKQSILSKKRWLNDEYKQDMKHRISEGRKKRTSNSNIRNKIYYSVMKETIEKSGYVLNTTEDGYINKKDNKISITCPKGHTFSTSFNRWVNNGCLICFKKNKGKNNG